MEPALAQVGSRLRALRQSRGMTLEELASAAQLSASTLSRLESGKRQANLELLLPLTRELGARLDDLIPTETPDPRVHPTTVHQRGLVIEQLSPANAPVQTCKITYPPTEELPTLSTHGGYEWLYVMTGKLRLRVGDRDVVLARGEAAEFDTQTPHAMSSVGGRPTQVISIFSDAGARIHTHGETWS